MTKSYYSVISLYIFLGAFLTVESFGQIQLIPYDSVAVTSNNENLINPWAGGLNCPQFSEIDLNGDGQKDLVAFERNFYGVIKTYINQGIEGEVNYIHAPEFQLYFPNMRNWMLLRDYNCDGKEDIFTWVPAGMAVYENISEARVQDPIFVGYFFA